MYHILVVDDEPLMRTWLTRSIPKYTPHFDVPRTARDGLDALECLKESHYDLVITDIKMPQMDGLELARHIHEYHPTVSVIIISGYNDFAYARKAIQYGVKDYLLKPLVDKDLIQLLEETDRRLQHMKNSRPSIPRESPSVKETTGYVYGISANARSSSPINPIIRRAQDYIAKHYCENISLSDLADYCQVNSSYLSDLFHRQLGISYSKYLMQIRMEEAALYLQESPEIKIYELAQKLGFVSTRHFISVFKKYHGRTPSAFRKAP